MAKSPHFDGSERLDCLKRGANIMRWAFGVIADQQRASANEKIHSLLLGERFVRRLRRRIDKLIVARPERELIQQILRFDEITRRVSRSFDAFVLQVKRDLRRAMALVRD